MRHDTPSHDPDPSRQVLMDEAQRLLAAESERLRAWSDELQEKLRHLRRVSVADERARAAAELARERGNRPFPN